VGTAYQLAATATGQVGTVAWSIASGALPAGLSIDASTGTIAGTPTAAGTFTALVQGRDSYSGRVATAPLTLTIAAGSLAIGTTTLPDAQVGVGYQAALAAVGGTGTMTWSITAGALPVGLALSASGVISGTPVSSAFGTVTFTVQVRDGSGSTAAKALSMTVSKAHVHTN